MLVHLRLLICVLLVRGCTPARRLVDGLTCAAFAGHVLLSVTRVMPLEKRAAALVVDTSTRADVRQLYTELYSVHELAIAVLVAMIVLSTSSYAMMPPLAQTKKPQKKTN